MNNITLRLVDAIAIYNKGYFQSPEGIKQLGYSQEDLQRAIDNRYIEIFTHVLSMYQDGDMITQQALRLTEKGKKIARNDNTPTSVDTRPGLIRDFLAPFIVGVAVLVTGIYVFGVGR